MFPEKQLFAISRERGRKERGVPEIALLSWGTVGVAGLT